MNSSEHGGERRYLIAINGSSGSSEEPVVESVCERLAVHGDVELHRTADPEGLDVLLQDLDGRALIVVGGDGSIHAAVSRARRCGVLGEVVLGLVPLGTGNDLARTLGIPLDPEAAADAIGGWSPRPLDLVTWGDGQVAVNAIHAGIGADAAERAQPMKEQVGALAYSVGAVAAGVAAEGWDVDVQVDGISLAPAEGERTLMVAIGNGRTIGGGRPICPDAEPGDGALDVVVSRAVAPPKRAGYGAAVLRGTHLARDDVATARGSTVTVRGDDIPYNVDGELVGSYAELTFHVEPAAWRLLAP